jgi:hypothetical protein
MIRAINAGFGDPLPAEELDFIRSIGASGVRQDVPNAKAAPALVANILGADFVGLFVIPVAVESACQEIAHAVSVRATEMGMDYRCILEVGNEEDLEGSKDRPKRWARDPKGWAALVADVALIARSHSPSLRVVSGGVSSVSRRALQWLELSRVRDLPVGIGYHQYRSTPPDKPLEGYVSRSEEFTVLRAAAGDRPLWMTECGWHTAQRESGCWPFLKRWHYIDSQVAEFLRAEIRLNEQHGAEAFVLYQISDGPDPKNDQDHFGIRRVDGTLKPSARVFA